MPDSTDLLEGQEINMLNSLLVQAWPKAKAGDEKAADRVIKILQLKARYGEQAYQKDGIWD